MNPILYALAPSAQVNSPAQPSTRKRNLGRMITWGAFSLVPAMFAAEGPPPVTIAGPVTVQGVVEVINDVLRQPYRHTVSRFTTSTIGAFAVSVAFDVPVGKRLIVETITIQARLPAGQKGLVRMFIRPITGESSVPAHLDVKSRGSFPLYGNTPEVFFGTHAAEFRVDGTASNDELFFNLERDVYVGAAYLEVSVFGYTVDIAQ